MAEPEITDEPGPLWPDDVVAGAVRAFCEAASVAAGWGKDAYQEHDAETVAGVRAALSAPEVTAHLLAQHKDGYDSGVEASRAERREVLAGQVKPEVSQLLAENARLAAALADATGKITAASVKHRPTTGGNGGVSEVCAHCDWKWPCPTRAALAGDAGA